ncbi:putative acyl-CoA dehydrogenase FadE28 [Mycobacterium intracellulare subsp. yongonense]|nr:putative acyl-CoA dehydrogenase FadE28 [Mycobacterium intracellulare subsp. yongonense]
MRPTGGGRSGEALRWLTIQGAVIASAAVVIASAAVVIASAAQPGAAGRH